MVSHLVRADVRRFRLAILGWILLEAILAVLAATRPSLSGDPRLAQALGAASTLLWLAMQILAIVLTVLIVQTHSLVGTDAFWTTRPIPPRTLLAAKASLLVTLMVGIPNLCELVLMVIHHVPAGPMVRVGVQTALLDALWLALVMAGAVVTASLASFAMLVGAVFGTLATVLALQLAYFVAHSKTRSPTSAASQIDDPTGAIAALILSIAALFGLVLVQYRTRSRWHSCALGALSLGIALTIAAIWPWPLLQPHVVVPGWTAQDSTVRLTGDPATVSFNDSIGWQDGSSMWRTAHARVSVSGIESGWIAAVGLENAFVELDNGVRLQSAGGAYPSTLPMGTDDDHPEHVVTRELLGVQRLSGFGLMRGESPIVLILRDDEFSRHASRTGRYSGHFIANLTYKDVAGVLPLRAGAVYQDGPYRLVLEDVLVRLPTVQIHARQSNAISMFDRRPAPTYTFYLRNSARNEAVAGIGFPRSAESALSTPFEVHGTNGGLGFDTAAILIRFPADFGRLPQLFAMTQPWLEGAELVIVRSQREGSVERTLDIAGFPLQQQATNKDDVEKTKSEVRSAK